MSREKKHVIPSLELSGRLVLEQAGLSICSTTRPHRPQRLQLDLRLGNWVLLLDLADLVSHGDDDAKTGREHGLFQEGHARQPEAARGNRSKRVTGRRCLRAGWAALNFH